MGRSWAEEKSFYPLILCLILLLHGTVMIMRLDLTEKQAKKAEQKKPLVVKLNTQIRKQIVQSEDSENKTEKDDAFLSDKTRAFDRQTRARKIDKFNTTKRAEGGGNKKGTKDLKLSDLGASPGEHPLEKAARDYTKQKNGDSGKDINRSVSSTNDYLQDIPLGDLTNLNSVEYKYYGFYHRIRQKLEQFWGRSLYAKAEQMAKEGRRVPASEEVITSLVITLDPQGEIVAIKIVGSSGIKELDDAAIESFNEAGPFPNPPKGLIVDGKVTLEWGFVVNT
jgi:TonB family protein